MSAVGQQRRNSPVVGALAAGGRRRVLRTIIEAAPDAYLDAPKWFFYLFTVSILMRDSISSWMLNQWVPYATTTMTAGAGGGFILYKIHPGSWGILICGSLAMIQVLPRTRFRNNPLAFGATALVAAIALLLLESILRGSTGSLGYLIDSILVAPLALFAVARLSVRQRLQVVWAIVALFLLDAAVVLVEFVIRQHLLPYPFYESTFRPAGVFGHPLLVGMFNACVIPSIFLFSLSSFLRWTLALIFAVTVVLAQARVATAIVGVLLPILLFQHFREGVRSGRVAPTTVFAGSVLSLAAVPLVLLVAYETGALDRVLGGFVDDSSRARVVVYEIFNFFTLDELMFGVSLDQAGYYARAVLGLSHIESPIVIYVLQFGIVGAIVFVPALLFFYISITLRAPFYTKLAVAAFLAAALSNNTLASKGPGMVTATVLTFIAATVGASRRIREELQAGAQGGSNTFVRYEEAHTIR